MYSPHGFTSRVTIDFAAGLTLPAFFFWYSASRSSRIRAASASSSSSSDPKRSTSSSSSSSFSGALAGFRVSVLASGPYAVYSFDGSPGRAENSDSKDAMCLYQRYACGNFSTGGADLSAWKHLTSACEGVYLDLSQSWLFHECATMSLDVGDQECQRRLCSSRTAGS